MQITKAPATMTSLELVDTINEVRAAGTGQNCRIRRNWSTGICLQRLRKRPRTTASATGGALVFQQEQAMGNALGKNVMQARINALTMKSADVQMLKTAKHIEENGLQENRSMRRHAKKEQQRLARLK